MNFLKSLERDFMYEFSQELAQQFGKSRAPRPNKAQLRVAAEFAARRAQLHLGYVTEKTTLAYVGDRVRWADQSCGAPVIVEGSIVSIGRWDERIILRLPQARGGFTEKRVNDNTYLEVLPRPEGWVAAADAPSVLLLKSPEWQTRKR